MQTLEEAAIQQIAESLNKCEKDLLLNRVNGWGAWITATYPRMVEHGLAHKTVDSNGLRVTFDTPLALAVKAYLERNEDAG